MLNRMLFGNVSYSDAMEHVAGFKFTWSCDCKSFLALPAVLSR